MLSLGGRLLTQKPLFSVLCRTCREPYTFKISSGQVFDTSGYGTDQQEIFWQQGEAEHEWLRVSGHLLVVGLGFAAAAGTAGVQAPAFLAALF